MDEYTISYAQNREDVILAAFFPDDKKGFYIDVGANHPTHESVTKYFYERGWHGINIEPIRRLHLLLEADRPRDINLNIGVGSKESILSLREYTNGDGLSTFSEEMKLRYEQDKNWFASDYTDYEVGIKPLRQIINRYANNKTINFLKIDVEGLEYDVLASNDWVNFRPQVVCVESNHILNNWEKIFHGAGYEKVFNDGFNDYYCDKNIKSLKKEFDYAEKIIIRPKRIINWAMYTVLQSLQRQIKYNEYKVGELIDGPSPEINLLSVSTKKLFFASLLKTNIVIKNKIKNLNYKKPSVANASTVAGDSSLRQSLLDDVCKRYEYYSRKKILYLIFWRSYSLLIKIISKLIGKKVAL